MIAAPSDIWGINAFKVMVNQLSEVKALNILGVSKTMLKRYMNGTSNVPRMAVLALYWETPYGRGMIDSHHMVELQYLHRQILNLQKENARLHAYTRWLMAKGNNFGAANDPIALSPQHHKGT